MQLELFVAEPQPLLHGCGASYVRRNRAQSPSKNLRRPARTNWIQAPGALSNACGGVSETHKLF